MAVKLRLRRMGRKKLPFYRIVAIDSRARRDGEYLEKIGHYNPVSNPAEVLIDKEKALKWLKVGAIPSDTVKNLLSKEGIMMEWDLIRRGLNEAQIEVAMKDWLVKQEENKKRVEAEKAQKEREKAKAEADAKAKAEAEEAAAAAKAAEEAAAAEAEADAEEAETEESAEEASEETTEATEDAAPEEEKAD